MVTHRTPEAATDQPFGHTCSVKPMSTWKLSFCCTIHLIVANGTKLATMTSLCWHGQVLLHQDVFTPDLQGWPQNMQLPWTQVRLHQNFGWCGFTKFFQHLLYLRDAIDFHNYIADLNFLVGMLFVPSHDRLRVQIVNNDKSFHPWMTTKKQAKLFGVLTLKFCLKDGVTIVTLATLDRPQPVPRPSHRFQPSQAQACHLGKCSNDRWKTQNAVY